MKKVLYFITIFIVSCTTNTLDQSCKKQFALFDSIAKNAHNEKYKNYLLELKNNECYKKNGITKQNMGILIPLFNDLKLFDELERLYKKDKNVLDTLYKTVNLNLIYYYREKDSTKRISYLLEAKRSVDNTLLEYIKDKHIDLGLFSVKFALENKIRGDNYQIETDSILLKSHLNAKQLDSLKRIYKYANEIFFK